MIVILDFQNLIENPTFCSTFYNVKLEKQIFKWDFVNPLEEKECHATLVGGKCITNSQIINELHVQFNFFIKLLPWK